MFSEKLKYFVLLAGCAFTLYSPIVSASPSSARLLLSGEQIAPPRGFVAMCQAGRSPTLCAGTLERTGETDMVTGALAPSHHHLDLSSETPPIDLMTSAHNAILNDFENIGAISVGRASVTPTWYCSVTDTATCERPSLSGIFPMLSASVVITRKQINSIFSSRLASTPATFLSVTFSVADGLALPTGESTPVAPPSPTLAVETLSNDPRKMMDMLKKINRTVNSRVRQDSDTNIYGVDEYWIRSGVGAKATGDCEDIAIEKRIELENMGFPKDRMAFAVAYSRVAGLHTVLVVRMDHADLVLDNRTIAIRPWSETGYSYISLQNFKDPSIWNKVQNSMI